MSNKRKYSSQVVDGYERAASRAMPDNCLNRIGNHLTGDQRIFHTFRAHRNTV
jgi:hypothetical protein